MEKRIKDYLHLYSGRMVRVKVEGIWTGWSTLTGHYCDIIKDCEAEAIELDLRKLDSMTEEERNWIWQFEPGYDNMPFLESLKVDAGITNYLLSKGFDLFGLIDAGLAFDLLPSNLAIDKNK